MRSIATLLLPFLLIHMDNNAFAQSSVLRGLGVKGGITSAKFNTNLDEASNYGLDGAMGVNVAFFTEWSITRTLSLVTQVGYTQRRFEEVFLDNRIEYSPGATDQVVEATSRLDYLAIPVLGKLRHVDEKVTGYLLAGPRLDLLINRNAGTWEVSDQTLESPMAEGFRSWAAGVVIGAGIEIDSLLPSALIAEVQYNLDFTDSMRGSGQRRRDDTAVAAWRSAFEVSIGILF